MHITNKLLLVLVVVLVIILIALVSWRFWGGEPSFYAVHLSTGDLFFGRVSRFPSFGLKQAYLFQLNPENQEEPVSVQRFKNIFWGPEDLVRINKDHIIWKARLDSKGQLAELFRANPDLVPQQVPTGDPVFQPDFSQGDDFLIEEGF